MQGQLLSLFKIWILCFCWGKKKFILDSFAFVLAEFPRAPLHLQHASFHQARLPGHLPVSTPPPPTPTSTLGNSFYSPSSQVPWPIFKIAINRIIQDVVWHLASFTPSGCMSDYSSLLLLRSYSRVCRDPGSFS